MNAKIDRYHARDMVSKKLGMPNKPTQPHMIKDGVVYNQKQVHSFAMGDVEDPEIYCAHPIYEWQQTDHGKWVMSHGLDPTYIIRPDNVTYGYKVLIAAHISDRDWTEYCLRFIDKFEK
jgi:hypothetical protein